MEIKSAWLDINFRIAREFKKLIKHIKVYNNRKATKKVLHLLGNLQIKFLLNYKNERMKTDITDSILKFIYAFFPIFLWILLILIWRLSSPLYIIMALLLVES